MKLIYSELNNLTQRLAATPIERSKVIAAGVGMAVASVLPLPTSETHDIDGYFNMMIRQQFHDPLSDIGESVVMDTETAVEFGRMQWMLRYAAAFPCTQIEFACHSPYGFFDTLAGVNLHVSQTSHEFLNAHKNDVFKVMLATLLVIKQGQSNVG